MKSSKYTMTIQKLTKCVMFLDKQMHMEMLTSYFILL